jgi:hypothetical protein
LEIAQGDANKMWIVPSEFSKALEGLAGMAGGLAGGSGDTGNGSQPGSSWLSATSTGGQQDSPPIATDGWFDSNLPPAATQPEAGNLRASDSDPDSRAAHEGMADSIDPSAIPAIPALPAIPPLPNPDELPGLSDDR